MISRGRQDASSSSSVSSTRPRNVLLERVIKDTVSQETNIKEKIFVGIIDLLHHLRHVDSADEDWAVRLNTFRSFDNTNTFTR